jgi:SAM-dependent methyltransferase
MIYVLEHIGNPREFLSSIKKLLKPDGKLVILVPNIQDALVNLFEIPEFRSFYYCIEHLYYYSNRTLARLLEEEGFDTEVELIQEYPITNHLNWAYRRAPSDTLAARQGVPDLPLAEGTPSEEWEKLWDSFNAQYREFLLKNDYGDRVWAVASLKKK